MILFKIYTEMNYLIKIWSVVVVVRPSQRRLCLQKRSDPKPAFFATLQICLHSTAPRNRNVLLYDALARETILGGLFLTTGVKKANLYMMVEILLIPTETVSPTDEGYFSLRGSAESTLERNNTQFGNWVLLCGCQG